MRDVEWTPEKLAGANLWVDKQTTIQLDASDMRLIAKRVKTERNTSNVLGDTATELVRMMDQINSVLLDKAKQNT